MKYITKIILLLSLVICIGSCRRATDNGKIDGFWQIREICFDASGESEFPTQKFIAVDCELIQLNNPGPKPQTTGLLIYQKGDKVLGVDFRYSPSAEQLAIFGFAAEPDDPNICKLDIIKLNNKNLVLKSRIATIICKKY